MNIQFADGQSFDVIGGEYQTGIVESADIDGNRLLEQGDVHVDVEFKVTGDLESLLMTRPELCVDGELVGWLDVTKVTPNGVSGEFWPVERGAPPY